jgi:ribosomal-protein-alanine N-acetyltransferase
MSSVTEPAIRPATEEDVNALLKLERQAATAAHWSRPQYEAIFRPDFPSRLCLVAEYGQLQGFLVAQTAGPEWELENIVVAPAVRRRGVATQLVRELLAQARQRNAEAVLLEVRASNAAARALYQSSGFEEKGLRPRYYSHPQEDAIIYRRNLGRSC